MKVVKKLAAKLKIEFAAKFCYPLSYVLGLQREIFFIVKAELSHFDHPLKAKLNQLLVYHTSFSFSTHIRHFPFYFSLSPMRVRAFWYYYIKTKGKFEVSFNFL